MPNHRALALVTGALLALAGASALAACTGATPPATDPPPPAAPVALPTSDAALPASMTVSPSPAPTPSAAAPSATPTTAGASPSPAAGSPAPAVPTDAAVSFQADVEPILRNRCSACHTVGSGGGAREVAMFNRAGQVQYWEIADEIDDIIEQIEEGEMPKGAPPGTVKPWELDTLRAWYRAGTPNN